VTMDMLGVLVMAPMKRTTLGWRSRLIKDTCKNKMEKRKKAWHLSLAPPPPGESWLASAQ